MLITTHPCLDEQMLGTCFLLVINPIGTARLLSKRSHLDEPVIIFFSLIKLHLFLPIDTERMLYLAKSKIE